MPLKRYGMSAPRSMTAKAAACMKGFSASVPGYNGSTHAPCGIAATTARNRAPGKVRRALTADDQTSIDKYWNNYVGYKEQYKKETSGS